MRRWSPHKLLCTVVAIHAVFVAFRSLLCISRGQCAGTHLVNRITRWLSKLAVPMRRRCTVTSYITLWSSRPPLLDSVVHTRQKISTGVGCDAELHNCACASHEGVVISTGHNRSTFHTATVAFFSAAIQAVVLLRGSLLGLVHHEPATVLRYVSCYSR